MSLQVNSYPIASYHQQAGGGGGSSDFYPAYASHQFGAQHSAVSGTRYSPYTATDSRPLSSSSGEHLYPSSAASSSSSYFPGWSQQRTALWPSSDSYIFPASVMSPTLNGAASLAAAAAASVTGVTGDFGDMQHGASAVTGGFRMPKRRTTANKKERRRTLSINTAFASLRGCIPNVPSDTKLSKIKTLRLATSYIAYLMDVLSREDSSAKLTSFKADISRKTESKEEKKRREAEEMLRPTSSMVERKAKGRTGWPQHVWAAELGTGGTVAPPPASSSSSSVSVPPPHHDSHLLHQQPIL